MTYTYCPECAARLEQLTTTEYRCSNGHQYFNNPKATVAVIFIRGHELLFSKRAAEPNKGRYDFPGGFLEFKEDVLDACIREIREETGLTVKRSAFKFLACYTAEYIPGTSVVDILFVVTDWTGEPVAADDSAALEWHPMDFLTSKDFAPYYEGLAEKLQEYLPSGA